MDPLLLQFIHLLTIGETDAAMLTARLIAANV